jgi:membrane-bound serine protease (ClpP class)
VLTFTTQEAIKYGFCEDTAEDIDEVISKAGIDQYEIREFKTNAVGRIIDFLINPYISGLLIMIIIGGIYFELQTPGIGFPLAASTLAAILYFAPLYLEGLAENWEIILFVAGIVLLLLEIFAIPGFGVAGVSGIILMVTGLTLSMVDNVDFEFTVPSMTPVIKSLFIVMISFLLSIVLSIFLSKKLLTAGSSPLHQFVLNETQEVEKGYLGVELKNIEMIGKTGIAMTVLRPSGKVDIEGNMYDAVAETGFVEQGASVKVVKYETGQLYVKSFKNSHS